MKLVIGDNEYATNGKLPVFAQLHVARKLGAALPVVEGLTKAENAEKDKALLMVMMFSAMNDTDTEFVIKKCLEVVTIKQATGYAKIQTSDGQLMFDTVGLNDILEIVTAVIEENLGDFFRTALARLAQEAAKTSS